MRRAGAPRRTGADITDRFGRRRGILGEPSGPDRSV